VGCGSGSGESSSERKGSLDLDGRLELGEDDTRFEFEDLGVVDLSILEDLGDCHLVLEGVDLELVEKGGLGSVDLITLGDDLLVGGNLDLGLNDLGLDVQVLEERGLLGVESGGTSGDGDVGGGDHTGLGGGGSDFGVDDGLDVGEVSVGEDAVDVSLKLEGDLFEVGVYFPGVLSLGVVLVTFLGLGVGVHEGGLHEGLLVC